MGRVGTALLRKHATPAGFMPSDLSGLALWFKADGFLWQEAARSTAAGADGAPVGSWDDASASAKHATQATSTKRGTLKTGILNGKPVIRFDGVDDFLQTAAMTLNQPLTYAFVAVQRTDPAANAGIIDGKSAAFTTYVFFDGATNKLGLYTGSATILGSVVTVDVPFIGAANPNGASSALRKDGGAAVTGNTGPSNPGGITIGAAQNGTQPSHLDVAEVVVYDSVLSLANLNLVGDYLASKYGLTWTPAT